jgi:5-methylcytosine-specific restriction endonuclease McrA
VTTGEIRHAIYVRQKGHCLWCSKFVTEKQAHMHEKLSRGRGGKISLDNSIILCVDCHLNVAHGSRKPQFGGGNT